MKSTLLTVFGLIGIAGIYLGPLRATETLTIEQKLRAENFQLKAKLSSCDEVISRIQLQTEQTKLVEEFRKQLEESPDAQFDWNTLTFKKVQEKIENGQEDK